MNPQPHSTQGEQQVTPDEQQLIAFHLGESCDHHGILTRLESDAAFAELSDSIARTLRVFSADPVPTADPEAAWQRLRGTLPPLETKAAARKQRSRWFVLAPLIALATLVLAVGLALHHRRTPLVDDGVVHLRPPMQASNAPGESEHLDRAERWLTVVNHTTQPLDPTTRAEGRQLLTQNAVYLRDARSRGDLADAAVLDRLDRVLTTSNHPATGGLQLRLDMNTDGLLFQIRILRQNQSAPNGDTP